MSLPLFESVLISISPYVSFSLSQVIYKLTDFGYAKQYDNSSVCTSLVGTVQYVVSTGEGEGGEGRGNSSVCTSLVGTVQYVVREGGREGEREGGQG